MTTEQIILIAAILLMISILAGKLTSRFGIPALLIFLGIGMLAGVDGIGRIDFDFPWLVQTIGSLALAFILFAGGLDTNWQAVRPAVSPAIVLSTVGVAISAITVALFAHFVLGLPVITGLLLGAITASTDAAAVFSIMRSSATRLKGRLEPLLEIESGSNDPMAVVLTLTFIQLLTAPQLSWPDLALFFLLQFGVGALAGILMGRLAIITLNRLHLDEDGLYPVLTIAFVLLTYGLTAVLGGNFFLAIYLAGIILGNASFMHKTSLTRFHDGLAWLMQITMFLILGLQVYPSQLPGVFIQGLTITLALVLIARPLSVTLSLLPFRFNWREIVLVSWVGLRGAAPIVLASFPLVAGIEDANLLFHLVFFVVLVSVLIQGSTVARLATWLKLNNPEPLFRPLNIADNFTRFTGGKLSELVVPQPSWVNGKRIVELDLPASALIVLIERQHTYLVPRGDTVLQSGDKLLFVADQPNLEITRKLLLTSQADSPDS